MRSYSNGIVSFVGWQATLRKTVKTNTGLQLAHIFKHPDRTAKGIVVFTHKELEFLRNRLVFSRRDWINPFTILKKAVKTLFNRKKNRDALSLISDNYFIGIHWGFFSQNIETPEWVDFHMAAEGTCSFNGSPYVIPLSSANFTPKIMKPIDAEKYWDVLCVAKNDKKKNYDLLINQVRKIYDCGYKYRILFVIASNRSEPEDGFYTSIFSDYFEKFSATERERFTIIKTHPETGFQGFSYSFLSHIYSQSKIFTIFSQREGECRAIKEAQLCGLPVVVKDDMEGGGRDYLNEENSSYFSNYDNAFKALIEAVENFEDFKVDYVGLEKHIGEESSLRKLKTFLEELYENNGQVFDGELLNTDNLNRRLPSHFFDADIRWANAPEYRFKTTDIVDQKMLSEFCDSLYFEEKTN